MSNCSTFSAGKRGKPAKDAKCITCGVTWIDHPRQSAPAKQPSIASIKVGEAAKGVDVVVVLPVAPEALPATASAAASVKTCPKCFFAYTHEHICGNPFAVPAGAAPATPVTAVEEKKARPAPHTDVDASSCQDYERSIVARGRIGFDNPCKKCKVPFGYHVAPKPVEAKPVVPKPAPATKPAPEPKPVAATSGKVACGFFVRTHVARGHVPASQPCATCGAFYSEHAGGMASNTASPAPNPAASLGGFTFGQGTQADVESIDESWEFKKAQEARYRNLRNLGILEDILNQARSAVGDIEDNRRVWWFYEAEAPGSISLCGKCHHTKSGCGCVEAVA